MASSTVIPNPITNKNAGLRDTLKRIKKKKLQKHSHQTMHKVNAIDNNQEIILWKSEDQQKVYTSKLFQALRQVWLGSCSSLTVREAADHALAMTAKGQTVWSRAILTNKLKPKLMMNNLRQRRVVRITMVKRRLKKRGIVRILRKVRDLGQLVPGCRKQPLPIVLEEVSVYISALEMQVKAMAALADILSSRSNSGSVLEH